MNPLRALAQEAKKIIAFLISNNFYAECPCCSEPMALKEAGLFYVDDPTPDASRLRNESIEQLHLADQEIRERRKSMSRRSETGTRAVNLGFILERLAPSLRGFQFNRNDCRSLFDPIDYVIFEGLSRRGLVDRILFVDIKTGKSRLSERQQQIRDLVSRKRVSWDTYQPEER